MSYKEWSWCGPVAAESPCDSKGGCAAMNQPKRLIRLGREETARGCAAVWLYLWLCGKRPRNETSTQAALTECTGFRAPRLQEMNSAVCFMTTTLWRDRCTMTSERSASPTALHHHIMTLRICAARDLCWL